VLKNENDKLVTKNGYVQYTINEVARFHDMTKGVFFISWKNQNVERKGFFLHLKSERKILKHKAGRFFQRRFYLCFKYPKQTFPSVGALL